MFVINRPVHLNDKKNYHRKKKFFKTFDQIRPSQPYGQNYDLRLIILRHAERVDIALGENWYNQVFGGTPSASSRSYLNPILPQRLPHRLNTLLYVFDPPITRTGEQKAFFKGQELARLGSNVDYCYASPASRTVISANAILQGMNRSHVPIRLEPCLFEPMNWNTPFQTLGNVPPFMSSGEWIQTGYNIDRRYRRLNDYLDPYENETDFYMRSQLLFQTIEQRHARGYAQGRRSTVLIVGHAATPVIFPTIALEQPFNAGAFGQQCANVPFLHTIVLERDAMSRIWSMRPITSFV